MEYRPVGTHISLDCFGISFKMLNDYMMLLNMLLEACVRAKVTIVNINITPYRPQGVTVIINVAESHMAIYSYPEKETCMIDILLCGEKDAEKAAQCIIRRLKPKHYNMEKKIVGHKEN